MKFLKFVFLFSGDSPLLTFDSLKENINFFSLFGQLFKRYDNLMLREAKEVQMSLKNNTRFLYISFGILFAFRLQFESRTYSYTFFEYATF